MNKALVTLDLKKDCGKLVQKATEWANAFGSEIVLLHVELMDLDNKSLDVSKSSDVDLLRGKNLENLNAIESQLATHGIQFKRVVRSGNPQDIILETAKAENADIIFMGLNQHSAAYKFLIGSVADLVVKKTEIPVLLIPND